MFSLIKAQEQLIERYEEIEANGTGLHKKRSRGKAELKFLALLGENGFLESQAEQALKDARDMWRLQVACEVE